MQMMLKYQATSLVKIIRLKQMKLRNSLFYLALDEISSSDKFKKEYTLTNIFSTILYVRCTHGIWRFPGSGLIRAVAAGLHHSHSNVGSEPHLRPTPLLTAMLDP